MYPPKYTSKNVRNPLSVKKVASHSPPKSRKRPAPGAIQEALTRMNKAAMDLEKEYKMSLLRQRNGSLHPAVREVIEKKIKNATGTNVRIPNGVPLPRYYDWYGNATKANKIRCGQGTVFNPWSGKCVAPKSIRNTLVKSVKRKNNASTTSRKSANYSGYLPGFGSSTTKKAPVMNASTRSKVQAYIRKLNKPGSEYMLPNVPLPYPAHLEHLTDCPGDEIFNPWTGRCSEKLKSVKNYARRLASKKY